MRGLLEVLGALAGGLLIAGGLVRLSPWLGLMDHPRGRKQHAHPTPLCGGLTIWITLVILSVSGLLRLPLGGWDWAGLNIMALLGVVDDRYGLSAKSKAVVSLAVAFLLAAFHGRELLRIGGAFPLFGFHLPNVIWLTGPLLLLWFWFLPQAINLMDGINGLVGGFSILALWVLGAPVLLLMGMLGVLVMNFPKARLFLGDCGALLLGTLLAILAVNVKLPANPNHFFVIFAYPMVDVAQVVIIRILHRQPLGVGDRNHLHHWMMDRCGSRPYIATPILLLVALGPLVLQAIGVLAWKDIYALAGWPILLVGMGVLYSRLGSLIRATEGQAGVKARVKFIENA